MEESKLKRPTQEEFHKNKEEQAHKKTNPLRDLILGGQDGLVNSLGIIFGVSVATADVRVLITTVIAAGIAESISMGAVVYTSGHSQKDFYESERRKEAREIEKFPDMEREEVRKIYEEKGFSGEALSEIVRTITSDKKIWLDVMMAEELHLEPLHTKEIVESSIIVTISTAIGHLIPLLPFFYVSHLEGLTISIIISAISLFAVGAYQALTLVGSWWKTGLRITIIGLVAAAAGYFIAKLFHATV